MKTKFVLLILAAGGILSAGQFAGEKKDLVLFCSFGQDSNKGVK